MTWRYWVLLLAALVFLPSCSKEENKKKAEPPSVPVTLAKAEVRDMPVTLRVVGRAEAYESVTVKSRVDGQVEQVLFVEGQHVKPGELLLRLDPRDFAARLKQAQAAVARDAALAGKTRSDTERYTTLYSKNFVSGEKVNDVRANEEMAVANLNASKAAVELARLQLSYVEIRAPIAGIVGERLVFPGSSVKTNDTTLALINRVSPLLVSFSLPEKHLHKLRLARSAQTEKLKVDISLPEDPQAHFDGQIHFVDNAVDAATGTILMKALTPNADERLTPGQFLNVNIILETLKEVVAIPNQAVQQADAGNFTFVVTPDQSVEIRQITIAATDGRYTAVSSGLKAGETVVTDGQLRLAAGTRVHPVESAPKAAQPDGGTTSKQTNTP